MYKEAAGTVISVKKQWWLKVNAKRVRLHAMDGAMFPHIVKVEYTAWPVLSPCLQRRRGMLFRG